MKTVFKNINEPGMSDRSSHVVSSRPIQSLLVLLAIFSMVLASPVHLLLAHSHHGHHVPHGHELVTVEMPVHDHAPVSSCQHHEHCSAHLTLPALPQEEGGSDPCEDHSGDCDTCTLLASIAPLHIGFDLAVSDQVFLSFTDVIQEAAFFGWSGSAITSRGPPARI